MSVFVLKLIAVCSMLSDHIAVFLYPMFITKTTYVWMRCAGRVAFPIFAFLIVNGYQKTHDVKRYLTRLIAFAAVSEIPHALATGKHLYNGGGLSVTLSGRWFVCVIFILVACVAWLGTVRRDRSVIWPLLALVMAVLHVKYAGITLIGGKLNVFYTLSLGLALIAVTDAALKPERDVVNLLMEALALFGVFFLLGDSMEYRTLGVALIFAIWIARGNRFSQAAVIVLWCVVEYIVGEHPMSHFVAAASSVVPILLYNGRQGPPLKLAFYAIYPAHLLILGMLRVYYLIT